MSTDSKLEALRTGLEMAQELLAIKREALGDDYRLTRTYWEAERELQAALAEAEQEQAGEAVAWLVIDSTGQPMHAAGWEAAAHEHINDAINEYDLHEASEWRVVPVYTRPLEPLTQTKLIALWADKSDGPSNAEIVSFARAIELAVAAAVAKRCADLCAATGLIAADMYGDGAECISTADLCADAIRREFGEVSNG